MESRRSSDAFAALVAAGLLLLAALGNALALLLASALSLVVGWGFFRPREGRRAALAMLTGAVVAAVIAFLAKGLH